MKINLSKQVFAVIGASRDTGKYGFKVFMSLKADGHKVYPVNPKASIIQGFKCYPSLSELPEKPDVVVTVVPPGIALAAVKEAARLGIQKVWMQQGSESAQAIDFCKQKGLTCITNTCIITKI